MREQGVGDTAEELTPNWAEVFGDGKGERKSKSRGNQNENVHSIDIGERWADRPYLNTKEQRNFQKLEIMCCRKLVPASGPCGCRNLGAESDAPSAEWSWRGAPWATGTPPGIPESVLLLRHRLCFYLLWISQFQLLTRKTWLCFSHFHRPLLHREQKEPMSRFGMFLLLQEVGPALPFTGAPSASPESPWHAASQVHPDLLRTWILTSCAGFCLQSVIWEVLMEGLTSLLAPHP